MCGITGFLTFQSAAPSRSSDENAAVLASMNQCLVHRGPDEDGFLHDEPAHLAMRRLKVIDLSTGRQPIFNEDKSVALVFNGEIYNYVALRAELIAKGHRFATNSDTEVLVHLYEEHGPSFPGRMRGMFAFALWDVKKRELVLGRDHFGIKPLYWGVFGNDLLFGSEIKALRRHPDFQRRVNADAIDDFLTLLFIPSPNTIYENLFRVEPGTVLVAGADGRRRVERFWHPLAAAERGASEPIDALAEAERRLSDKISECVKMVLRSDVPLGIFLSGGIDSTMMAYYAAQHQSRLKSFTIFYPDSSYSERAEAASVARLFGTEHTEIPMSLPANDLPDLLWKVLSVFDEPFGDLSSLPTYLLCEFARRRITVALSGDGGDELFGGYPTIWATQAFRAYRHLPAFVRDGLLPAALAAGAATRLLPTSFERVTFDYKIKRFILGAKGISEPLAANFSWRGAFYWDERRELYSDAFRSALRSKAPYASALSALGSVGSLPFKDQLMFADLRVYLPDQYLVKNDMLSMAHSLELRPALLDAELAELAFKIPARFKVKGLTTKWILRRLMRGKLPADVLSMPKKGFTPPLSYWLAEKRLQDFIRETTGTRAFKDLNIFKDGVIGRLLDDHREKRADCTRRLWAILSLASFARTNAA